MNLLGVRRARVVIGLIAAVALSTTPQAMAAEEAPGVQPFCIRSGDCGYLVLLGTHTDIPSRGAVIAWTCAFVLTSNTPNFLGAWITECKAVNTLTGSEHGADPNPVGVGSAGAAHGARTTTEVEGTYKVCIEGNAFYIDGAYDFSGCSDELLAATGTRG